MVWLVVIIFTRGLLCLLHQSLNLNPLNPPPLPPFSCQTSFSCCPSSFSFPLFSHVVGSLLSPLRLPSRLDLCNTLKTKSKRCLVKLDLSGLRGWFTRSTKRPSVKKWDCCTHSKAISYEVEKSEEWISNLIDFKSDKVDQFRFASCSLVPYISELLHCTASNHLLKIE